MSFVHLHTHSHYSLLEGLPHPKDYVKKAADFGMSAVALTDTGNIHGCFELYKYAKEYEITPLVGAEIFVSSILPGVTHHKLVLLALSDLGYRNLIEIVSWGHLFGNNSGLPIVDRNILSQFSQDIVCLSGPISGEISYGILTGKSNQALVETIAWYQATFGRDNYFLELLSHSDIPKQDLVTERLVELHTQFHIPVVATNNCYYIDPMDRDSQDVIMSLGTGHQMQNPDRPTMRHGDYSFLSGEQMERIFGHLPQSLENTAVIAKRVSLKIQTGKSLLPKFELIGEDINLFNMYKKVEEQNIGLQSLGSDEFLLRYLCFSGMNKRYKTSFNQATIFELIKKKTGIGLEKSLQETQVDELRNISPQFFTVQKHDILSALPLHIKEKIERLEYELFVVHEMGFDTYFLIVSDYINWARENSIPVGPGRGSAAGALLAYLTGITDLDPIQFDLLFERFLNPARVSMPDIDTDFSDDGRDRVVEYCRKRYGENRVVQICTFGTFAARAAFKDAGRVRGISFADMNEAAKYIPEKPGTKLTGALEISPEFKQLYQHNPEMKVIIDDALKIEGNVRQIGVHACAVIIAPDDMRNYTALQHPPKDSNLVITQYDAKPLEDIGLLKMDFLGLRNLTIIQRTLEIIQVSKAVRIDILNIPLDDPKVFEVFAAGDTTGVFQFESTGMRTWLKSLKPTDINDIIAMVSLYRPGPMQFIQYYIDRKYRKEKVEYMYDELAQVLKKKYGQHIVDEERKKLFEDLGSFMDITYGISVYQEQLMRIVQAMAGFSLAEADMLRRGVGKKKKDIVEKIKVDFTKKASEFRGYKPETADYIYEKMIMPASDYSFNKSHAACYALIAYQTAYLKAHYPTEFFTSLMTSDEEDTDRIALEVDEIKQKGIEVLAPSVNTSLKHFTYLDDTHIQFGLSAIKGLGTGVIDAILSVRRGLPDKVFISLEQFIQLTGKEVVGKKSLESLILSGSLDALEKRSILMSNIDTMIRFARQKDEKKDTAQIGLFEFSGQDFEEKLMLENNVQEMTFEEKLYGEKEVLGFMVSGHPFDGIESYIQGRTSGMQYMKMSMEDIQHIYEQKGTEEKKKAFIDSMRKPCKGVGVISDVRKIITKTGKNMMFLSCESFDFDFEVTLHDRDIQMYGKDIAVGKVIILEEALIQIDPSYGRKTILPRKFRLLGLSQIRSHAADMNLVSNKKRHKGEVKGVIDKIDISGTYHLYESGFGGKDIQNEEGEILLEQDTGGQISSLEEEINTVPVSGQMDWQEYIIAVSTTTSKDTLLSLKSFLLEEKIGEIKIYLDFKGQKIDTKVAIRELGNLQKWLSINMKEL